MHHRVALKLPKVFFITIFLGLAAAKAAAFTISPMLATLTPTGTGSIVSFKLLNDSDQPIAVSVSVLSRSMDLNGVEKNEPADKIFLVFPSKVVIQPRATQTVKIQYKGPSVLTQEMSYRVLAEQLPVEFAKEKGSGVTILLRYLAALYVSPKNVEPNIKVGSIKGTKLNEILGLQLELINEGTQHALLFDAQLRLNVSSSGSTKDFLGESMSDIQGKNLLPKMRRFFFIPWENAVVGASYEGAFDAELEY